MSGLFIEQFRDAFGGSGGELDFAPDFRELAERTCGEDGIDHELAQGAAGEISADHFLGAEPEQANDGAQGHEDDCGGENGAGEGALGCGRKGKIRGV